METICMGCQILFSGENKKNIISLSSAELLQRVVHVKGNYVVYYIFLTPMHVLFFICLYSSSRALSKVFEHRNSVARYGRETNYICESFAPW